MQKVIFQTAKKTHNFKKAIIEIQERYMRFTPTWQLKIRNFASHISATRYEIHGKQKFKKRFWKSLQKSLDPLLWEEIENKQTVHKPEVYI